MAQYRKLPVVIEAFRLGTDLPPEWFADKVNEHKVMMMGDPFRVDIQTLEGTMRADTGDWIIKGVKGEIYPCKADIFWATYEAV